MSVPPATEECLRFMTDHEVHTAIFGDFELLEDEDDEETFRNIRVRILETTRERAEVKWESDVGASEGRFRFEGTGSYHFCITNGLENEEDEIDIAFNIRLRSLRRTESPNEYPGPDDQTTADIMKALFEVENNLHTLLDHQGYMREREVVHRDTAEATFARVVNWTIIKVFVVLGVAFGQIWYLKKFFEKKRYL